jgi:ABC-2 type transport system ATP-binding protein
MIQVNELTKQYPGGKGIKNLNLQLNRGEAFGFLGPNGAGKTTTIRILMGLIKPDSGQASISGLDCWQEKRELKRVIGYLPGELHFLENFTGRDFLDLLAAMHGAGPCVKSRVASLTERFNLDTKQVIRKMSKGMKQKLGIIIALMTDAELIILDEPTTGLDPLMQKELIDVLTEERDKGKTILMSSHQFPEVEQICKSAGMIRNGELLAVQDIAEIKKMECHRFEIEVESGEDAGLFQEYGFQADRANPLRFHVHITGDLNTLWQALSQIHVKKFRQQFLELDEAFIHFYQG